MKEKRRLNDILWRAFGNPGFRRRFYEEDWPGLLTSLGCTQDEIKALLEKDIDALMFQHHLYVRGPLRWGTFWLPWMVERSKRTGGRKFTVEDALRLQQL
jgi:hypothetical protein